MLGYARVSSEEQARDGVSLDAQVTQIRACAQATGAELVDMVIGPPCLAPGCSPTGPPRARIAALLDARKPEADAVVMLRLDRLGRDAAESLTLLKRLRKGRIGLVGLADDRLEHAERARDGGDERRAAGWNMKLITRARQRASVPSANKASRGITRHSVGPSPMAF